MKYTNYSSRKVSSKAIMVVLSLLVFGTMVNAQVFKMGNRDYRFEDSKWLNYSSGIRGDVIVPERLIVRLTSRKKPTTSDFMNIGISGVSVVSKRLLADYYVLEIKPNFPPEDKGKMYYYQLDLITKKNATKRNNR